MFEIQPWYRLRYQYGERRKWLNGIVLSNSNNEMLEISVIVYKRT